MSTPIHDAEKDKQFWIEVRRHILGVCAAIAKRYGIANPLGGSKEIHSTKSSTTNESNT